MPKYIHECDGCRYLGGAQVGEQHFDLYACWNEARMSEAFPFTLTHKDLFHVSLLARGSDEDSEYSSAPLSVILTSLGNVGPEDFKGCPGSWALRMAVGRFYRMIENRERAEEWIHTGGRCPGCGGEWKVERNEHGIFVCSKCGRSSICLF